jgi:hypothetical protein
LLHFFSTLLKQTAEKADWGLDLPMDEPAQASPDPTTLH